MKRMWFKAKDYGWGWYPASWQGWLILIIFLTLIVVNMIRLSIGVSVADLWIWYISETILLVAILIFICYLTGEKPEWRWGGKSIKKKKE